MKKNRVSDIKIEIVFAPNRISHRYLEEIYEYLIPSTTCTLNKEREASASAFPVLSNGDIPFFACHPNPNKLKFQTLEDRHV